MCIFLANPVKNLDFFSFPDFDMWKTDSLL